MMKQKAGIASLILASCLLLSPLAAAEEQSQVLPAVGVIPFDALGNKTELASVASSLTDFLTIDFKISGRVVVKSLKRPSVEDFTSSIPSIMKENKLDYLLFGSVRKAEDGGIDVNLFMFDGQGAKLSAGYRKVGELFELSDAGDSLFAALAKNVGTIHHGFGAIAFSPSGSGNYEVYLNGSLAGRNLASLENVLNGKHFVEVKQQRPFGVLTVVSESFTLGEGERVKLGFALPEVTPEEKAAIEGDLNAIKAAWKDPDSQAAVELKLNGLEAAFKDISSCPGLADCAARTRQLRSLWEAQKLRFAIEAELVEFDAARLVDLKPIYESASTCPEPDAIRAEIREDVAIAAALRQPKAVASAASGDWINALKLYRGIADDYAAFGMELPPAYAADIRMLESVGSTFANTPVKGDGGKAAYKAASGWGAVLVIGSAVCMAVNAPSLIDSYAQSSDPIQNIFMGVASDGLLVLENVGLAAGSGLFAFGSAGQYRTMGREKTSARDIAAIHFGKRLKDTANFAAALPSDPRTPCILVVSDRPGTAVRIDRGPAIPTPLVVAGMKDRDSLSIDFGTGSQDVLAEARTKILFLHSGEAIEPIQTIAISGIAEDASLKDGILDLSWKAEKGAVSYRCVVYSKAAAAQDSQIEVFNTQGDTSLQYCANLPGRELSFEVYKVDADGYSSPIAYRKLGTPQSLPLLRDQSRPVYLGLALGSAVAKSSASYTNPMRIEPSLLFNFLPRGFLFGAGFRLDADVAGQKLQDWGVYPMAVFGDIDSGVFHLMRLGVTSDGFSYTFDLGYGEGMSRAFVMPSFGFKLGAADGNLGAWSVSLVAGTIL